MALLSVSDSLFSLLPEALRKECCCAASSVSDRAIVLEPACEGSVDPAFVMDQHEANPAYESSVSVLMNARYPCLLSQHAILQHDPAEIEKTLFPNTSLPQPAGDELSPEEECPSRPEAVPEDAESPCFQLTFLLNGEEKSVLILRRALGLQIGKTGRKPCKVINVRPGSYAFELGIEVGWILKEIDGEDVSKKPLEEVQEMMKKGLMTLPK